MSIEELENDIKNQFISLYDSVQFIANYGGGTEGKAYKLLKTKLLNKQVYLLLIDDFYLKEINVYEDDYAYDGKDGEYITITFICQQLEKSIELNKPTNDIKNYGFGAKKFYYSVCNTLDIHVPESLLISAQSPDCYHDSSNPLTPVVQELTKENKLLKKSIEKNNILEHLPLEYLTIDEAIRYLEQILHDNNLLRTAKTTLEDFIRERLINPVFYYDGYAILYRRLTVNAKQTEKLEVSSTELKQVLRIKGYFYDSEVIYSFDEDSPSFNAFSDLNNIQFSLGAVIPDKIHDVWEMTTHSINFYSNTKRETHRAYQQIRLDKVIDFEKNQILRLSKNLPNINEELTLVNPAHDDIERRNVYFKSNDILKLSSQLSDNNSDSLLKTENEQLKQRITELEQQLKQAQSNQLEPQAKTNVSNILIANVNKKAIKQFNRSLADALIELDYKSQLSKGDIVNFIMPHMDNLALQLADENTAKAKVLKVTYKTIYDSHLTGLEFKQGSQTKEDRERKNIELLFRKKIPATK